MTDQGRGGGGGQPPGSVINCDPRTLVVVMYDSPPPVLRQLHSRWILMATGVVVWNMFVFPQRGGFLSSRCFTQSTQPSDRQHIGAVKVSTVLVDVTPGPVEEPVPTGTTGDDGGTEYMSPTVWQTVCVWGALCEGGGRARCEIGSDLSLVRTS